MLPTAPPAAELDLRMVCDALSDAHREICEWRQLARYQRERMPLNCGWCPTEMGLARTETVIKTVQAAFAAVHDRLPSEAECPA